MANDERQRAFSWAQDWFMNTPSETVSYSDGTRRRSIPSEANIGPTENGNQHSSGISSALPVPPTGGSMEMGVRDHSINSATPLDPANGVLKAPDVEVGEPIIVVRRSEVDRDLRGIHIFMITISGTLGVGLYLRSGEILRLAGPLATPLAFLIIGILATVVMQCIAEMICIWPITNALVKFPAVFVDEELGVVIGWAYWFSYSISFACLLTSVATEATFWPMSNPEAVKGCIFFFLIPLVLWAFNCFPVKWYGLSEIIGGIAKISFILILIVILMPIAISFPKDSGATQIPNQNWQGSPFTKIDKEVGSNWFVTFCTALSVATYAFVGIEIPAIAALEAKASLPQNIEGKGPANPALKFSSIWLPVIVGTVYVVASIIVCIFVPWDHPQLPRYSWLANTNSTTSDSSGGGSFTSVSAFVLLADGSTLAGLASAVTFFLVFTAISAANTNIYIASRTIYGLYQGRPWFSKFYGPGKTTKKIPIRAICLTCCFFPICFITYVPGEAATEAIDVLAEAGSACCVFVWLCECYAFIRLYRSIHRHKDEIEYEILMETSYASCLKPIRRYHDAVEYPYKSIGQPKTAWLAIFGCVWILIISNSAAMWKGFQLQPFLSGFLPLFVIAFAWVVLKLKNGTSFKQTNLKSWHVFRDIIKDLHTLRGQDIP
ncbi:hypothetical protein BP6252_04182 [Coleophoma cylindrospora]|uniref:Amino acid permease/ SLC12A domain-containing protein n=1 Tax=Coleophoma cylindrospora TaxID=1849047 RepID=A0A3D8S0C1_9HELO|nr:hypothetical protein BP6252_04182 [Coleophoma cylindrospora]